MSRYLGPKIKIIRRLGPLPGLTCKESIRKFPPGEHGKKLSEKIKKDKISQFSKRLYEKQKARYHYGLTDGTLLNYVRKARKSKESAGEYLLQLLEMRLDNIVFRCGYAPTILSARQLVNHGHILVNEKSINIPSYTCQVQDQINLVPKVQQARVNGKMMFSNSSTSLIADYAALPNHLVFDETSKGICIQRMVSREDISLDISDLLILEYYSRKL